MTQKVIKKIKKAKKKRGWLKNIAIAFALCCLILTMAGAGGTWYYVYTCTRNLPDVNVLKEYRPSLITELYDDDDNPISQFYIEKRILLPLSEIPVMLRNATIAVEDSSFYSHGGINIKGIFRAALTNLMAGRIVQGGSTITQQLTKTMFLTPERTIKRKIREIVLAHRIEKNFTKNQILEIYRNQIYYGHWAYGVEAAARTYFGKGVKNISLDQIAMIVAQPKAPRHYSPYFVPRKAKKRRNHVLRRMTELNYITHQQANALSLKPIVVKNRDEEEKIKAPYFTEYIRKYLMTEYGSKKLYRSGLRVYTTLNLDSQLVAEEMVKKEIEKIDKRLGYRGPIGTIELEGERVDWDRVSGITKKKFPQEMPEEETLITGNTVIGVAVKVAPDVALIDLKEAKGELFLTDMAWAHLRDHTKDAKRIKKIKSIEGVIGEGDIIRVTLLEKTKKGIYRLALAQHPIVQGALLALEPETGYIRAMVGGYDFSKTQFNRAVQAKRQPGSAFKPLIYSAAFAKNQTPASIFIDSPVIFEEGNFASWKPVNFEQRFYGPVTLRKALTHSRNVVTVKLLQSIGIKHAVNHIKKFKLSSTITPDLSLALGTSSISLLELTSTYGVFANRGIKAEPMAIKYITDSEGNLLESHAPVTEQIISEENAFLTASLLQSVVRHGTGRKAKNLDRPRPVGAKTGTTNDFVDAWFIGFTPNLATGVWVGMDYKDTLGKNETGSRSASPIWVNFMREVLKDEPVVPFSVPPGIVYRRINPKTALLSRPDDPDSILESFIAGTEPTQYTEETDKKLWEKMEL